MTLMPTICTESALEDLPDAIYNIFFTNSSIYFLENDRARTIGSECTCEATSVTDPEEDVLVLVVATPPPESMY